MTEDRDKWRKYVHGVANPRIEDAAKELNTTTVASQLHHSRSHVTVVIVNDA